MIESHRSTTAVIRRENVPAKPIEFYLILVRHQRIYSKQTEASGPDSGLLNNTRTSWSKSLLASPSDSERSSDTTLTENTIKPQLVCIVRMLARHVQSGIRLLQSVKSTEDGKQKTAWLWSRPWRPPLSAARSVFNALQSSLCCSDIRLSWRSHICLTIQSLNTTSSQQPGYIPRLIVHDHASIGRSCGANPYEAQLVCSRRSHHR